MSDTFNKILIPVDFSLNTETAVYKAAGFAGMDVTIFFLLHVVRPGKSASAKFTIHQAEKQLMEWKIRIEKEYPNIEVRSQILRGHSVQKMIIEGAGMLSPDLIVIGKQHARRRWLFSRGVLPDILARKTNCPVLTVKPGSVHNRPKLIVIPIRHFLPERKLELGILLARKYKAQVHLLAIQERAPIRQTELSQVFLKAYHQLREKLHHPVEYSAIAPHNTAKATLDYAELIMADLILLNPRTESGISGLTGFRHISDWLKRDSKIQVLDIEPYN